jgi:hypothetical protein
MHGGTFPEKEHPTELLGMQVVDPYSGATRTKDCIPTYLNLRYLHK